MEYMETDIHYVFKDLYLIINMSLAQGNKKNLPIQTWKLRNTSNKDLWYGTYQILDKKFQYFRYLPISQYRALLIKENVM